VRVLRSPVRGAKACNSFADLRSAAASDDREQRVQQVLEDLHEALLRGELVELTWPSERDVKFATALLAAPLASVVANAMHGTRGSVVIHTRSGMPADFLALPATHQVCFITHVNSEEAAMRWERVDPEPGRRIAAASRLRAAGWQVTLCIGPVRCFDGWRDEYADLVERIVAAGFSRLLLSFAGQNAFNSARAERCCGDDVVLTETGYVFQVVPKQQVEFYRFISAAIANLSGTTELMQSTLAFKAAA
jgi:hypothetical protein